jgi:phosphate transport system substrate-binding protein
MKNSDQRRAAAWLTVAFLSLGVLTSCGPDDFGDDFGQLEGNITVVGSSTVFPLSTAVTADFEKKFPGVKVPVSVTGTGGGFQRFTNGEADVSNASRPIKLDEVAACKTNGIEFVELAVAYDGLTIVVNPQNTWATSLTVEQLNKIYIGSGAAKTWQDVNPEWPAEQINAFAAGRASGTFDYFMEVVAKKGEDIRPDASLSEDDNVLVRGVVGDKGAIAFFGASYYFANQDKLKAVPIVNPETGEAVLPSADTIENGEYAPFSRPLFIYVNTKSLRRPEVREYVGFFLDHAADAARKVSYVALPGEIYERVRAHATKPLTGTHFYTSEGQKRHGSLKEIYQEENLVGSS